MAVRFNLPIISFLDANANPLAGGYLEFYETESDDAKDIWEDDDLTIQAANIDPNDPDSTGYQLDSAGRHGDIFLEPGDYKVVVKNSLGTIIKTMDPVHGGSASSGSSSVYDVGYYTNIKPDSGETWPIYNIVRPLRLEVDLADCIATVHPDYLPTATATYTIYKNGVSIGTIAFATSGAVTKTLVSSVDFEIGDQFSMTAPDPQDATMNFVAMTFAFTVR
jgi:hypothetical protein